MSVLADVILAPDTRANQPAASTVADGTLYFVTDEGVLERADKDNNLWESYAGAAPVGQGNRIVIGYPSFGGVSGEDGRIGPPGPAGADGGAGGGAFVQRVSTQTGAVASNSTTIPLDDSIPQNTEGSEYMTLAITPTDAANKLQIDVSFFGSAATAAEIAVALFQDTTADALAADSVTDETNTARRQVLITHTMTAGTTSATTFKVRAGTSSGSELTFNGVSAGRLYGGVAASSIVITEYVP